MTNVLRIAHLKIAHHICNPKVGKRERNPPTLKLFTHIEFWFLKLYTDL